MNKNKDQKKLESSGWIVKDSFDYGVLMSHPDTNKYMLCKFGATFDELRKCAEKYYRDNPDANNIFTFGNQVEICWTRERVLALSPDPACDDLDDEENHTS